MGRAGAPGPGVVAFGRRSRPRCSRAKFAQARSCWVVSLGEPTLECRRGRRPRIAIDLMSTTSGNFPLHVDLCAIPPTLRPARRRRALRDDVAAGHHVRCGLRCSRAVLGEGPRVDGRTDHPAGDRYRRSSSTCRSSCITSSIRSRHGRSNRRLRMAPRGRSHHAAERIQRTDGISREHPRHVDLACSISPTRCLYGLPLPAPPICDHLRRRDGLDQWTNAVPVLRRDGWVHRGVLPLHRAHRWRRWDRRPT